MSKKSKKPKPLRCAFNKCEEDADMIVVIRKKQYPLCTEHYSRLLSILDKACQRYYEADLDDIRVVKKGDKILGFKFERKKRGRGGKTITSWF